MPIGTEADRCRKYVLPKLYASGWTDDQMSEVRTFTDGCIVVIGDRLIRRAQKRADYLLRYSRDFVSGFVRLGCFLLVARFARVIALDTPHHVTPRGNARQFILTTDAERLVYLDLLAAIRGPAPLFIAERRRQTHRWIRDFGSSPGQPGIGRTISRREPRQPRPFARAPIPDGRSAHRNLSKGWNATPAAPSSLRKAVGRALVAQKGGRPRKSATGSRQSTLNF